MDERIPHSCESALAERGFTVIKLRSDERLSPTVASHTDMLFFRHNNTLITSQGYFHKNQNLINNISDIPGIKVLLADEAPESEYPKDRIFNCLILGDKLFAKTEHLSKSINEYANNEELKIIPVSQGYPACVTLGIGDKLAITADSGMARALKSENIEIIDISDSEAIKLPPYKFGFIGGTAGVFRNTVYFIGNLAAHPCGAKIEGALKNAGYECVSLDEKSDSLFDMGGIFFFENPDINTATSGKKISPNKPKSE